MAEKPVQGQAGPRRMLFSASGEQEVYAWTKSMGAQVRLVTALPETKMGLSGIAGLQPGMWITLINVSGSFEIRLERFSDAVVFHFPTAASARLMHGSSTVVVTPGEASAVHSRDLKAIGVGDGSQHIALAIMHDIFVERLSDMLDRPILQPIAFEPKVSLQTRELAGLAAFVQCLAASDFGDLIGTPTLIAGDLPKILADMFMQFWPHNHTDRLAQARPVVAPRHVKRALDHIHANPAHLSSPTELAHISGVSLRTLQYAFRTNLGMGIDEYQRSVRLQKARDEILRDPNRSIGEISLAFGFSHPKQFSTAFKAAFGLSPTEFRNR